MLEDPVLSMEKALMSHDDFDVFIIYESDE